MNYKQALLLSASVQRGRQYEALGLEGGAGSLVSENHAEKLLKKTTVFLFR